MFLLLQTSWNRGLLDSRNWRGMKKCTTRITTQGTRMNSIHRYSDFTLLIISMDLVNAVSLEGYLEKESPGLLKIFQKRYVVIRGEGQYFVWFKKKPASINDNPKGILNVDEIIAVEAQHDDEFSLKYGEREFLFRAEGEAVRDRWVKSLQLIMEHFKKLKEKQKHPIKVQKEGKSRPEGKAWRWENVGENVNQQVRIENEKVMLADGENNIHQRSQAFFLKVLPVTEFFEIQHNVIHGFCRKKGFITDDKLWCMFLSEVNLNNPEDSTFNERAKAIIEMALSKQKTKEQDSEQEEPSEDVRLTINRLYFFDEKTELRVSQINLEDVLSWQLDVSQQPFQLSLKYTVMKEGDEEEAEVTIVSEYLSQIKKWERCLQIAYEKYSVKQTRIALLENRFDKFDIKCFRLNEETQWRQGTTININKAHIKLDTFLFDSKQLEGDPAKETAEFTEGDTKTNLSVMVLRFGKDTLNVVFKETEAQRSFRRKVNKIKKRIESEAGNEKKVVIDKAESKETEMATYLIDKKMRETNSSIKVNFYDVMNREVPKNKPAATDEDKSIWGRFVGIFCAEPPREDYFA